TRRLARNHDHVPDRRQPLRQVALSSRPYSRGLLPGRNLPATRPGLWLALGGSAPERSPVPEAAGGKLLNTLLRLLFRGLALALIELRRLTDPHKPLHPDTGT